MMEGRLVVGDGDRAVALRAAQVVNAVHDLAPGARDLEGTLGPYHAVAGDECREPALIPAFRAVGSLRQDEIPELSRAVPDLDGNLVRHLHAELGQHAPWVAD